MSTAPPEAFFYALAAGAASLALWDAMHGLRVRVMRGAIGNFVLDTTWWVVNVLLFLGTVWQVTEWRLRFFEVFAWAFGAGAYHVALSRPLRRGSEWVFGIISKIIGFIFKILLTPAQFLYKILIGVCKGTASRFRIIKGKRRKVGSNENR